MTFGRYYAYIKQTDDFDFCSITVTLYTGTYEEGCGEKAFFDTEDPQSTCSLWRAASYHIFYSRYPFGEKNGNDDGKTGLALPVITSMFISFEKKNEKGEMDSNPSRIYRRSLHIDSNTYYSCNYLVKSEG